MADQEFSVAVAVLVLDGITQQLQTGIKSKKGFDTKTIILMVKGWAKVLAHTQTTQVFKGEITEFVRNGDTLEKRDGIRPLLLRNALDAFQSSLDKHGTKQGQIFDEARMEMREFLHEYRKTLTSKADKTKQDEIKSFLNTLSTRSAEQVMKDKDVVVGLER